MKNPFRFKDWKQPFKMRPREIAPGETAELRFELPEDIQRALEAGGTLTTVELDTRNMGNGHFQRDIMLAVDGVPMATLVVAWEGEGADLQMQVGSKREPPKTPKTIH